MSVPVKLHPGTNHSFECARRLTEVTNVPLLVVGPPCFLPWGLKWAPAEVQPLLSYVKELSIQASSVQKYAARLGQNFRAHVLSPNSL